MNKKHILVLSGLVLVAVLFSAVQLVLAVVPNPGHSASEIEGGVGSPTGAVGFFNLAGCPSGWTDKTSLWTGRYVVAKPSGGTLAGTTGTALTNNEDRATGRHLHRPYRAEGSGLWDIATDSTGTIDPKDSQTEGTPSNWNLGGINAPPDGTNAPYVQLLICQKD